MRVMYNAIMMDKQTMFIDWVRDGMRERNWSQVDLARHAEMTRQSISALITGKNKPGMKICTGIARAFNLPPEEVHRKAGLLPPQKQNNERTVELKYIFNQLDNHHQELVLNMVRSIREQQGKYDAE